MELYVNGYRQGLIQSMMALKKGPIKVRKEQGLIIVNAPDFLFSSEVSKVSLNQSGDEYHAIFDGLKIDLNKEQFDSLLDGFTLDGKF